MNKNINTQSLEIERRYLISYPDINILTSVAGCYTSSIVQTYLLCKQPHITKRVRERITNGNIVYTTTQKQKVTAVTRIEIEREITKDEYTHLLMQEDTSLRRIQKTRYVVPLGNQLLEIDIYPFWKHIAIAEVELTSETDMIVFPDFIHVISEVTGDKRYTNRALAKHIPPDGI